MKNNYLWFIPIVMMAILSPFTPWLDLAISHEFFHDGQFSESFFYTFLYTYGLLPAQIFFVLCCLVYLASYGIKKLKPLRTKALIMTLTMILGSGLITNVILKDHWGRPRPKQTIEFGGAQPFRPFYSPNLQPQPEPSRSFPCGHCSAIFFFFGLTAIGLCTKNRMLTISSLALTISLGALLGVARIAQGGHFFSDVLMSALIMWLTAYTCTYALLREQYP